MATGLAGLPRVSLAEWPTPLQEAPRLSAALGGPRILLKRDDAISLAFGGNKTRKLEYLLGDALQRGADTVITTGASTSNHCRQTAAACRKLGLEPVLVLRAPQGREPAAAQGNLLLDKLLDAELRFVDGGEGPFVEADALEAVAADLRARGRQPYIIPTGGSVGLGAVGYAHAMQEIAAQAPDADVVMAATGSGGTQAGLMLGRRLFGPKQARILGVRVSPDGDVPMRERIRAILAEAEGLVGLRLQEQSADLLDDYLGAGYGDITAGVREALALLARTEGVILDPVYTAKAMAALIGEVKRGALGAHQNIVFVHTGGGPGLFTRAAEVLAG